MPRLYRRLRIYAERSRPRDTISARPFLSHRRSPSGEYLHLTRSGLFQMVKNIAEEAGIQKRAYPHLPRHSSLTMIQEVYSHLSPNYDAYGALVKVLQQEER